MDPGAAGGEVRVLAVLRQSVLSVAGDEGEDGSACGAGEGTLGKAEEGGEGRSGYEEGTVGHGGVSVIVR